LAIARKRQQGNLCPRPHRKEERFGFGCSSNEQSQQVLSVGAVQQGKNSYKNYRQEENVKCSKGKR